MAKRSRRKKTYIKSQKKKRAFLALKITGGIAFLGILSVFLLFIYYAKDLPRPEKFTEKQFIQSTKIYDRTGEVLLYEIYDEEKRTIVELENISDHIKHAVIAAEDSNFYDHFGIDLKGIIRSVLINLDLRQATYEGSYGGSTIPQQLIRSTFFSTEKTVERKIREIVLALEIDRKYPKDQILEWYLNQIPFGSNCYGVEAASKTFFGKPSSEITPAEAAALTSLIQMPSYLSPYGSHKEALLSRKDYVLDRMHLVGYLSDEEWEEAKQEELVFQENSSIKAPHFVVYVIEKYLKPLYGEDLNYLKANGLKVYTSLDWELQLAAEKAIKEGVERNRSSNAHNAALASINPQNGHILAMVGSADWFGDPYPEDCISGADCLFEPKFNVTVGTEKSYGRQPGSSFKPFIYATAFKKGASDLDTVIDEETNFGEWGGKEYIPQNYDGIFRGEVTLREALSQSLNIPAVKVLLDFAGIEDSVKTAEDMGISTLKPPFGPSIVLGGWEVKLLEMVSAYGVFATDGMRVPPIAVTRIEDYEGNIVEEIDKTPKRVLPAETARLMNDVLSDNEARAPMFGLYSPLHFSNYDVAAKTGTTDDYRDAWTVGYSPSVVAGVWTGNSNNAPMAKKPGVMLSTPIWHDFMEKALTVLPDRSFAPPIIKFPKQAEENGENDSSD